MEKRKKEKFYKYARGNTPEDREKAIKQWGKLSEENQINFLKNYTKVSYRQSGCDFILNEVASRYGFSIFAKEFQKKINR